MIKFLYLSAIEHIYELPENVIIILVSKSKKKIDTNKLKIKRTRIIQVQELMPPKELLEEYKQTKDYELFEISYVHYLIRHCREAMAKVAQLTLKQNKKVFIVTQGKRHTKNPRMILASTIFKRHGLTWQLHSVKNELTSEIREIKRMSFLQKYQINDNNIIESLMKEEDL